MYDMKDYDEEYDDSSDDDDDTSRGRLGTAVAHIDAEAFVACCDVCYHDVRDGICDGIRDIWRCFAYATGCESRTPGCRC